MDLYLLWISTQMRLYRVTKLWEWSLCALPLHSWDLRCVPQGTTWIPENFLLSVDNAHCEAKPSIELKEIMSVCQINFTKRKRNYLIKPFLKIPIYFFFFYTFRMPSSTTNLPADNVAPPAKKLECWNVPLFFSPMYKVLDVLRTKIHLASLGPPTVCRSSPLCL